MYLYRAVYISVGIIYRFSQHENSDEQVSIIHSMPDTLTDKRTLTFWPGSDLRIFGSVSVGIGYIYSSLPMFSINS